MKSGVKSGRKQTTTTNKNEFLEGNADDSLYSIVNTDGSGSQRLAGGERVQVAVRCRPMMPHEKSRNDKNVIKCVDKSNLVLLLLGNNSQSSK